ncbi:MAG: ribose-5-phosphate isomerase RpiA [Parvularculaceae bacterium]|nr:ribose-5-phosphate isomerase RpiA [Parvularculaceae bacterium]
MTDELKKRAALKALDMVQDGMRLGLGTGSTAKFFLEALGERVRGGLDVCGVPTSNGTALLARRLDIPLLDPAETTRLDLAIDGADEVTARGEMIKGGGGAMLREKIVAQAADRFVLIADASKRVDVLGAFPLPVEIIPFGFALTVRQIREALAGIGMAGAPVRLRPSADGQGFAESDNGNLIADLEIGRINDPEAFDTTLTMIPGVVTTGLFIGLNVTQILATEDGFLDG